MVKTYDGIREVWPCISWGEWLSPNVTSLGNQVNMAEHSHLALAEWPFHDLRKSPVSFSLDLQPDMKTTKVLVSFAGIQSTDGSWGVSKDGVESRFDVVVDDYYKVTPTLPSHFDRSFFSFVVPVTTFSANPKLSISMTTSGVSVDAMEVDQDTPPPLLCHVQVHQYGYEVDFESTHQTVAAFPVFGDKKVRVGYRPTLDDCAMRRMDSTCFCPVCLEQLWRKVLPRSGLLRFQSSSQVHYEASTKSLHAFLVPLRQLKSDISTVKWYAMEKELGRGEVIHVPHLDSPTCISLKARLKTSFIRREPRVFQEDLSVFLVPELGQSFATMEQIRSSRNQLSAQVLSQAHECLAHNDPIQRKTKWVRSSEINMEVMSQPDIAVQTYSYGDDFTLSNMQLETGLVLIVCILLVLMKRKYNLRSSFSKERVS
jgi:hypothetical protein